MLIFWPIVFGAILHVSLRGEAAQEQKYSSFEILHEERFGITSLLPGDILVKPNHNWIPETSMVKGGKGFGHAAIVIKGASDTNVVRLLEKAVIFESQAREVAYEFQLRTAPGYSKGTDFRTANVNFGEQNSNYRYRLRADISEKQKQEIIDFILKQDPDTSCWRSLKETQIPFKGSDAENHLKDKNHWYCSLLIWQAFYTVAGIDLDSNQGTMVFPNDLVTCKLFENTPENSEKRVRF